MTRQKNVFLKVFGVAVELKARRRARWKNVRYDVFLAKRTWSSGMVWREGAKWASTLVDGPRFFRTRQDAIRLLVTRGVLGSHSYCLTRPASPPRSQKDPLRNNGTVVVRRSRRLRGRSRKKQASTFPLTLVDSILQGPPARLIDERARLLQAARQVEPTYRPASIRALPGGRPESNRRRF